MKSLLFTLSACLLFLAAGCYYDNNEALHPELLLGGDNCDTTSVISYQVHIVPIMSGSCGSNNSCHNAAGAGGGFVLADYAGVKQAVDSGKFLSAIVWDGNASQMPKNSASQINDCYIAQIQKWIAAGAPNN